MVKSWYHALIVTNIPIKILENQIDFPEHDIEYSVKMKIEEMTTSIHGQSMDELFKCENCVLTHPNGTAAVQARTLINIRKYMVVQLKTFDYNRTTQRPYKVIPKLQIEEQVNTILLGKLNLCAVIYHIGDSPIQGHYVASVKDGNRWYGTEEDGYRWYGTKRDGYKW